MRAWFALACLSIVLSVSRPALADNDPWLAKDKALHAGVSAGIAVGSYAISASVFESRGHALLAAGGVTLAIGAGKELIDLAGYGDPSWKDFVADIAGTFVGLALAWSIDLLVRGVSDEHPPFILPKRTSAAFVASPLTLSF
jgi:putative lipoprotein